LAPIIPDHRSTGSRTFVRYHTNDTNGLSNWPRFSWQSKRRSPSWPTMRRKSDGDPCAEKTTSPAERRARTSYVRSPKQLQDRLRSDVGLGQHRRAGLQQDLVAGEVRHLRGHVDVADPGLGSGQVLSGD